MTKLLALIPAVFLVGCASGDYARYAQAQETIESNKAIATAIERAAMYNALAKLAENGSDAAKVAAAMSINNTANGISTPGNGMAAPGPDPLLQWASVLVPGITQMYGVHQQVKLGTVQGNNQTTLGVVQSNNQAQVHMHSNATMQGIAGLIPTTIKALPPPVVVAPAATAPTTNETPPAVAP